MSFAPRACVAAFLLCLVQAGTARAADHVTYVLDWLPSGEETFPYVAQREGLFAREGLDVTIVIGRGSTDGITRLATGSAQFGSGGIGALMSAAAEQPGGVGVKAVLSVFNTPADAIFTVKGGPITSIASLKGHRLATATFTSSNVMWPVVARAAGLDPASVTLLKTDPGALAPLLASGQVDAMISWVTTSPGVEDVLSQAHRTMLILPWTAAGLDGYGLSLFASDREIRDHPGVVTRFTRAFAAAVRRSVADCHLAAADEHALVPDIDPAIAERECRTTVALISNPTSAHDGFGTFEPKLLQRTWQWTAKAQGYRPDQVDAETLVDRSFARQVTP